VTTGSSPSVTVVICAYTQKRWDDLVEAISSVSRQPEASEIVVVIDHEDRLLERVQRQWPELNVIPNKFRKGLSGARNTGVEHASSDVVAFLDDDATAGEGWLRELLDAFESPDVVAVGGSARPSWPAADRPSILPPELLWVVGCTYTGQPTTRADVRNIMGCSMAFRRSALMNVGGFNPDTGRVGSIPLGAEETEVCILLRQDRPASRIVFEPRSVVSHTVTRDRVTWSYLRRRSFYEGVSKSALSRSLGASDALASERAYVRRVLPMGAWRELAQGRPGGAAAIALSLLAAGVGYAYGALHHSPGSANVDLADRAPALP